MSNSASVRGMGAIIHDNTTAFFTAKAWQEDGVWNAEIVDLPVVVFGDTFEEATENLADALCSHLKAAQELGALDEIIASLPKLEAPKLEVEIEGANEYFWRVPANLQPLAACR